MKFSVRVLLTVAFLVTWHYTQADEIKQPDELKFYINAGHGGWGYEDRPMATVPFPGRSVTFMDYTTSYGGTSAGTQKTALLPDTCGFFESNTDLWKCEALYSTLIKMGAKAENLKMSRDVNGPYPQTSYARYDMEISKFTNVIAGEAEAFAPDLFISIHSDAGNASYGTSANLDNHVLFLYRGTDEQGGDLSAGSRDIAYALWDKHFMDEIDYISPAVTRTSPNIRGDFDFYGTDIDITNNLHSGIPYEGYLGVLKHGYPGVLIEGFCHSYEPERHRALNRDFCRQEGVRLARGIGEYFNMLPETTGYIMGTVKDKNSTPPFTNYNDGEDSYLPINGAQVKLYKGTELVDIYPTDEFYNGIFVFEDLEPASDYYISVVADGYTPLMSQGPFTVVANETTYSKLYMSQSSNNSMSTSELGIDLTQEFVDRSIGVLEGKRVRRAILHDGVLYVLAVEENNNNAPHIYQINPHTQVATAISLAGVTDVANENNQGNHLYSISDIAITSDGKLIACNQLQCQSDAAQVTSGNTRGTLRVYKWNSMSGNPTLWFTSQSSANWYKADVGNSMVYYGSSTNGKLITTATTTGSSRGIRPINFTIHNGGVIETIFNRSESLISANTLGEDYQLTHTGRHRDFVVLDGSSHVPLELQVNTSEASSFRLGELKHDDTKALGGNFFEYSIYKIYVTPFSSDNSNNTGIALYTANAGLGSAQAISATGTTLPAQASSFTWADGYSDGDDIVVYLLRDNLLSKWSITGSSQQPVDKTTARGIYAYDLRSTQNSDNSYTFQFKANYHSTIAQLVFYDSDTHAEAGRVDIDNVLDHELNTITLTQSQIPGTSNQVLNWGVYLKAKDITSIEKLNSDDAMYNYTRLGVTVDNSPESDYFGRLYLINWVERSSSSNGLWAFNQDHTRINSSVLRGGETYINPYRLATDPNGKIYIADWGDAHSGVYVASPGNLEGIFPQFFEGTRQTDGLITNNGANVASSNISVAIGGSGANTKMYTYLEDFEKNNVAVYNIGQPDGSIATSWGTAPSAILQVSSVMLNGNSDIVPDNLGGTWVSQRRVKDQNLATTPSLIHVNEAGNINFNSGNDLPSLNGSPQAGFAMNRDNTILAIGDGDGVIQVYDITWSGNTPTLTPRTSFSTTVTNSSGEIQQMDFDWGGNLYVAGQNLGIYSIPVATNSSTVPAKTALTVIKQSADKTLAQLVSDQDVIVGNTYTIADQYLTVAYIAKDYRTIYCKDDNGYAGKSVITNGQRDFIANHFEGQSNHDQSNWIAITLPRELTQSDGDWLGQAITGITGTLDNVINPAMTATAMPVVLEDVEANYVTNTFITCNFVSENWNNSSYFFVKPKPCEYAHITWAMWDDDAGAFIVPATNNSANLPGGFRVDLSMLDYDHVTTPAQMFTHGYAYQFHAIIKQNATSLLHLKADDNSSIISDEFTVFPVTYDALSQLPTSLSTTRAPGNATVVKTEYYSINGQLLTSPPSQGIAISKQYLSDGSVITSKIINQ